MTDAATRRFYLDLFDATGDVPAIELARRARANSIADAVILDALLAWADLQSERVQTVVSS